MIRSKLKKIGCSLAVLALLSGVGSAGAAMHCPLVLDLNGDGVKTGRLVDFDFDADGRRDMMTDISFQDAVLVFDADGNGISGENGAELFGDLSDFSRFGLESGHRDGFLSLAVLCWHAALEGVISRASFASGRLGARELAALERHYGLKVKVGTFNAADIPLAAAGITSITLSRGAMTRGDDFDGHGNALLSQRGATFTRADGSTGVYADIWFQYISAAFSPDGAV